jgi:hypothetical protein
MNRGSGSVFVQVSDKRRIKEVDYSEALRKIVYNQNEEMKNMRREMETVRSISLDITDIWLVTGIGRAKTAIGIFEQHGRNKTAVGSSSGRAGRATSNGPQRTRGNSPAAFNHQTYTHDHDRTTVPSSSSNFKITPEKVAKRSARLIAIQ